MSNQNIRWPNLTTFFVRSKYQIYIYIKNQLLKFYKTFRDLGNIALGLAMTATCGTGKVSWHRLKIRVNEHHKNIWYHHSTSPSPLTGAPDRHVSISEITPSIKLFPRIIIYFLESSLKWKLSFSLAVHTEQQQFSVLTTMRGPGFEIFNYILRPSWQNDHQQIEEKNSARQYQRDDYGTNRHSDPGHDQW